MNAKSLRNTKLRRAYLGSSSKEKQAPARGLRAQLVRLDGRLRRAYSTPEAELGNQAEPLDEAIYILLTFQTDVARARLIWSRLKDRFPRWDDVACASEDELADVLREGGLHRQKARAIKQLLADVQKRFGVLSLDALYSASDLEAEKILLTLHGLSWKGARCILLYSLGRQAFPVDGNSFRVLRRLGLISSRLPYRRRSLHDALQAAVVPGRRRSLHVNLVVHGQRVCLPREPLCDICSVSDFCKTGRAAARKPGARVSGRSNEHARRSSGQAFV